MAFIGNSPPRHCGIATFTSDLQQAVSLLSPDTMPCIVAMTDNNHAYDYPPAVLFRINDSNPAEYAQAAAFLNASGIDVVCLQHEFGIFGGEAGDYILLLLTRLTMPIVTTLHTVLADPTPIQRSVLNRIVDQSRTVVVMAEKGRELLRSVYGVADDKIEVVPHGVPDFPFVEPDDAKAELNFSGRAVILTFGLLSPNKGIEVMIDAMPAILKSCPDAVYVVLGATHPNLIRHEGEAYRESLLVRVRELGVEDHVVFIDQFVEQATLLRYISMCDVYVTPYLSEAQMTSGSLAYSFGLGRAVVSTPYWHARELLADGRGVLVPFRDVATTGREVSDLLTDDTRRQAMRKRAYVISRAMTWEHTAERYLTIFKNAKRTDQNKVIAIAGLAAAGSEALPEMRLAYFTTMCDDTGLFQHAIHSVPDRLHGYCVDDNARALMVACALNNPGEQPLPETMTSVFAAFVQHAWNPDLGRFRNFMSFDRRWLEPSGSEDSHGRTLWALGECARADVNPSRRRWAAALFAQALPSVEAFSSPRTWAFTLLGLDAYCTVEKNNATAERLRYVLADRLTTILSAVETIDWVWFEEGLAYDNARLPQALIATGMALDEPAYVEAGLRSLRWLMILQTAVSGAFRPVGSYSFGDKRCLPRPFDQQPLEAAATVAACLAAWRVEGDEEWRIEAVRSFDWFLGRNDLSSPLVDLETGSCCDGLHADRPNENRGGESVVSYLLALSDIRQMARLSSRMRDMGLTVRYAQAH